MNDFPDYPVNTEPMLPMCCLCYAETQLFKAPCNEKPELLIGVPLGMYHCPDCGSMVCAGFEHPEMCQSCIDKTKEPE